MTEPNLKIFEKLEFPAGIAISTLIEKLEEIKKQHEHAKCIGEIKIEKK